MTTPRFLQIHTLHPYSATLLNRDDSGLAKRLPYGGVLRTRVSSQCLKRHWRMAEDPHALSTIDGSELSHRSRELVTRMVIDPLKTEGIPDAVADALDAPIQKAVYGDKGTDRKSRQTLLLGAPELTWLAGQARDLAREADGDAKAAKEAAEAWAKEFKKNIHAMREATKLPGGLTAALFGRMVTADTDANIDAALHVAHAFTVHQEESESDYFTAVDDLKRQDEDAGADLIQDSELTSGLFYGYVVVDVPTLLENLGGDTDLAGEVIHNLLYLIAEVSPGAKLGATAPYTRANLMMVEAGDRQPRSLAAAYQAPCRNNISAATAAMNQHLKWLDETYATGEARKGLWADNTGLDDVDKTTLPGLAAWAQSLIQAQRDAA